MKKTVTILLLSIVFSLLTQAQNNTDANIFGDVQCEGEHVPFVNISIKGTFLGTTTDATGHYSLVNLPEGKHTIIASAVGYKPAEQTITIIKNNVQEVNFRITEDFIGLEEVVVSSDRNITKRREATVITNTINPRIFELTQSVSLVEGLDFSPGLRTECNCQNCGFSQVRMNGMEGPYSQILINSRPIFSGLAGVYGLELFPVNMVERVEIVRGGGSALFGGNAIAGTINIITKEPKHNGFSVGSGMSFAGIGHKDIDQPSIDRTLNLNGSIISDDKKSGLSIYGMIRDRDAYDENNDGFSEEVLMKTQTLGFSTFYKPTSQSKITFDLFNIDEFRRGGNKLDMLPHETDITEQLTHNILGANVAFDYFTKKYNSISIYTSAQKVDRESYYGSMQDPNGYGTTNDFTNVSGLHYTHNLFLNSKIIFGLDHKYSALEDIKLGANGNPNTTISNQQVNVFGSFFQYEMKIKRFKLGLGTRVDNYNIRDLEEDHEAITGIVPAPRANILYDITDAFQFRAGYARGYRAPQLYDEDLHIETSGARRITHENSPNLKQENSNSYNTSIKYTNILGTNNPVQIELVLEGFYTELENPFTNEYTPIDDAGNVVYTRINAIDGAMVYGTNYEANIGFHNSLVLQAGFTYQKSLFEKEQQWGEEEGHVSKEFMRSPNDYGYLTASFEPVKNFQTSLTGTYTGKMLVPHFGLNPNTTDPNEILALQNGDVIAGEKLETSDRFLNVGFQISKKFKIGTNYKMQLNIGGQNLLNQTQHDHDSGVYRDAGYIYGPHKARMLTFGLKIGNNF